MTSGTGLKVAALAALALAGAGTASAQASDPYVGQIMLFAGDYCPEGWANANGALMQVNSSQALYAVIGNRYGGTAPTTFALPDLRGRVVVGTGTGPGLTARAIGAAGGAETAMLTTQNLPPHVHQMAGQTGPLKLPSGDVVKVAPASTGTTASVLAGPAATTTATIQSMTGTTGASTPVATMPPFVALTACIATTGIYPTRP